jgi:tetratricopeptide (TPR) repeat protein
MIRTSRISVFGAVGVVMAVLIIAMLYHNAHSPISKFAIALCINDSRPTNLKACEIASYLDPGNPLPLEKAAEYLYKNENYNQSIISFTRSISLRADNPRLYVGRGNAYFDNSDFKAALDDFTTALQLDAQNAEHYRERGRALRKLNRLDEAIAHFSVAIDLAPLDYRAYIGRGLSYNSKGDLHNALIDFSIGINFQPGDAALYFIRGDLLYDNHFFEAAIVDFSESIRLDSKNPRYFNARGLAKAGLKNGCREAINDFDLAISIEGRTLTPDQRHFVSHLNKVNCLQDLNEVDEAIAVLSNTIGSNPNISALYRARGDAWTAKKNYRAAVADYTRAIRLSPTDKALFFNRGWIHHEFGALDLARKDYEAAIDIDNAYSEALFNLAVLFSNSDAPLAALNRLSAAKKVSPNEPEILQFRSKVLRRLYMTRAADADARKAISIYSEQLMTDTDNPLLILNLGDLRRSLKDFDGALADYNRVIELDPAGESAYFSRGYLYLERQQYDNAIIDFSAALAIEKSAAAYNNRGLARFYSKNYLGATEDFLESSRLSPNDPLPLTNRARALQKLDRLAEAIVDANKAIKLSSTKDWERFKLRADLWRESGNCRKAISDYSEVIRIYDTNFESIFERGICFSELGQLSEAISDFNRALILRPDATSAKDQIVLINNKIRANQRENTAADSTSRTPTEGGTRRVALVIGNKDYQNAPRLSNPISDALLIAKTLRDSGFDKVILKSDVTRDDMLSTLKEFAKLARNAEWAVIYFAGHGLEVNGVNYLVPVDGELNSELEVASAALNLGFFLEAVEEARRLRLVILDACRDNPFFSTRPESDDLFGQYVGRSLNAKTELANRRDNTDARRLTYRISSKPSGGLARIEPSPGTLVVYAAKNGQIALDGAGRNSPFAEAVAYRIGEAPPREVRRLFDFVREDVVRKTQGRQQPFSYGSLAANEDFFFR